MKLRIITLAVAAAMVPALVQARPRTFELRSDSLTLSWKRSAAGWSLSGVTAFGIKGSPAKSKPMVLYSAVKPSDKPIDFGEFPGEEYRYITSSWREATDSVALNLAGRVLEYQPAELTSSAANEVTLSYSGADFSVSEQWTLNGSEAKVALTLTARRPGWYSLPTPSVLAATESELEFALIPGVLHGSSVANDFLRAYAYGWEIPSRPVLFRERHSSTLTSILSTRTGLTVAVTAEPGTAAEPWGTDARSSERKLGLSAMNRAGELTPTLYHPVLGADDSYMEAGETRTFNFRVTFGHQGCWPMFNHVANNIYDFNRSLELRRNRRSLTDRLYGMHRYVVNDSTSRWHTVDCEGTLIGAQEYLGGVYMAKKDALKNADYGAMWMLGAMTADTLLTRKRLPYALNFKIKQHNDAEGPMHGASRGQYYLRDSHRFVEEWGPYTEPIATTYYLLSDLGNIALFEPGNAEVKALLRSAADWLMGVQKPDGSWAVAYADADGSEAFADLKDYRPTFYGLLVAYRILGDRKYLDAAIRGADWLISEAVEPQHWLGVCGDTRFAPDFAAAQAAQALLELGDLTGLEKYTRAGIEAARFYTTSVYTHPIASTRPVRVKGQERQQWEITTSGLSYEHGGIIGSTNLHGPILLASHAGMFVRIYGLTGERIFLDMARAAAIGRDAFVDDATAVASYYWAAMNRGAGPYPHHAWWQIGWITDYLLSELELRSGGKVSFPAGFITPKVGPHRAYAFAPGKVNGREARLVMIPGLVEVDNPDVEVILADGGDVMYAMLLNDLGEEQTVNLNIKANGSRSLTLAPYGYEILNLPK